MAQYDGLKNQPVYLYVILASASPGTATMTDGTVDTPVCPSVLSYPGAALLTNGAPAECWAILPKHHVELQNNYSAFSLLGLQVDASGQEVEPGAALCSQNDRPAHVGILSYNMSTGRLLHSTPGGWIDMPTGAPA